MELERRRLIGGLACGAGVLATRRAFGAEDDGHAAGDDVAASKTYVRTIPRKTGSAQAFTASLDSGPIKATSGGWARDITANQLPIATGIAAAHLFLNPGGVREMHWHSSAEWAYVIAGHCQATVVDPDGAVEIVNFGPGDTWSFPAGHAHAIQTLGTAPCHAILAFDDGLYGEHGTFGLSDCLSRFGFLTLHTLGIPDSLAGALPEGETYIMQGPVIPLDGEVARGQRTLSATETHRFALSPTQPLVQSGGSSLRVAPARSFPMSTTMTGFVETLEPGAAHTPHWHPVASEWHVLLKGRTRITMFEPEKRLASAELKPGDCAYLPRAAAHMVENIGSEPCEFVGVHNAARYQECSLSQWLSRVPRQIIAANLGLQEADLSALPTEQAIFVKTG